MSQKKINNFEWIEKAKLIHGDKYDYSLTVYTASRNKVIITCKIHGEFEQEANSHLQGKGCRKCQYEYLSNLRRKPFDEFLQQANSIHFNKYDYSKSKYNNNKDKICIICPKHGEFWQDYDHHIGRKQGCPICSESSGEKLIRNWLKENNIKFKSQFELITPEIARNSNLIKIDFFVKHNNKQYFIEYDGIQHFEYINYFHKGGIIDFEKQQNRDRVLNEFCKLHKDKVTLIRFNYNQSEEEIKNLLEFYYAEKRD